MKKFILLLALALSPMVTHCAPVVQPKPITLVANGNLLVHFYENPQTRAFAVGYTVGSITSFALALELMKVKRSCTVPPSETFLDVTQKIVGVIKNNKKLQTMNISAAIEGAYALEYCSIHS